MHIAALLALFSLPLLLAGDALVQASTVQPSVSATEGIALLAGFVVLVLLVRLMLARRFPKKAGHALIVLPVLVIG